MAGRCSTIIENDRQNSPKDEDEEDREENEAVAGDPFLVAEWSKAFDAPGRQVTDQLGVGCGFAAEISFHSAESAEEIIFAHTEFVVMTFGVLVIGSGF